MWRKLVVVVLLLGAGVAFAFFMRMGREPRVAPVVEFRPDASASAAERIAELERALAAQIDRSRTLEARIASLEERLAAGVGAGAAPARADRRGKSGDGPATHRGRLAEDLRADPAALRERLRERQLQRLVDAGFTRERAEWIERRLEELEVEAMQVQFDAQRTGRPGAAFDVQRALRNELGDAEYERYLRGTGRPTEVQVFDVLASSPAERAGLQPGDQIVSYAGTRVFDMRDLNALSREGNPGELVTMEVRRNGQTLQVQVPRGVLGLQGGALRGGGPRGGGGPPPMVPAR
jgi:hypothetical protein